MQKKRPLKHGEQRPTRSTVHRWYQLSLGRMQNKEELRSGASDTFVVQVVMQCLLLEKLKHELVAHRSVGRHPFALVLLRRST